MDYGSLLSSFGGGGGGGYTLDTSSKDWSTGHQDATVFTGALTMGNNNFAPVFGSHSGNSFDIPWYGWAALAVLGFALLRR